MKDDEVGGSRSGVPGAGTAELKTEQGRSGQDRTGQGRAMMYAGARVLVCGAVELSKEVPEARSSQG